MCMDIHFTFFFFFCLDLPVRFQFWVTENEKFSKTFKHNLKKKKKLINGWERIFIYLFIYLNVCMPFAYFACVMNVQGLLVVSVLVCHILFHDL